MSDFVEINGRKYYEESYLQIGITYARIRAERIVELESELAAEKNRANSLDKVIEAMSEELAAEKRRSVALEAKAQEYFDMWHEVCERS